MRKSAAIRERWGALRSTNLCWNLLLQPFLIDNLPFTVAHQMAEGEKQWE